MDAGVIARSAQTSPVGNAELVKGIGGGGTARGATIRGACPLPVMHPHIRMATHTGKNHVRRMRGRASALADAHHRILSRCERDRFDDPCAGLAARAVLAARD